MASARRKDFHLQHGKPNPHCQSVNAGGNRLEKKCPPAEHPRMAHLGIAQFRNPLPHHFAADASQQQQRHPVIQLFGWLGKPLPKQKAQNWHHPLEEAEGPRGIQAMASPAPLEAEPIGDRNGKGVHGEAKRRQNNNSNPTIVPHLPDDIPR